MVERAERNITLINMQKIANALGVEIGELLRYNYGEEAKI